MTYLLTYLLRLLSCGPDGCPSERYTLQILHSLREAMSRRLLFRWSRRRSEPGRGQAGAARGAPERALGAEEQGRAELGEMVGVHPDARRQWAKAGVTMPVCFTNCVDCGLGTVVAGEVYTVHDDIWEQAWAGRRKWWYSRVPGQEILCIGCLERRLGRKLVVGDFAAQMPSAWGRAQER